ncbi:MAG: DUF1549 domain-containing protein, partial [SAR202 cluster bacterium]|nr:DUF1549 domain-containing protein [SAR202 cluster bacterium]
MTATSRTRVSPAWGLLLAGALAALPVLAAQPVKFSRDVQPILALGGLRLDDRNAALKGGTHGPVLVPGKAAESRLIGVVAGTDRLAMPPTGKRLTPREIGVLTAWVNEGAAWEGAVAAQAPHWAFQAPNRPVVPAVRRRNWVRNPIDAFVAAEQERRGLTPRAPADRSLLLRRVYLDLVGLPPTRAELLAFLADTSPDAYEKVVDRLLASPHYGERWARHWMDVWRYSDWYGRRAVPDVWNSAPQIWRWRDWIVRSLNEDRGYDRMVQEMLAGDELAPGDPSRTVATGYLVRNWYALNPNQWMRDNVEHTGKAFLGLTLNCAHCHDHKYDPVTQEEYFRFRAFFEPLQL